MLSAYVILTSITFLPPNTVLRMTKKAETRTLYGSGYKTHLTPLDPEKDHNVGGVACVLRSHTQFIIEPQPELDATKRLLTGGRLGFYAVPLDRDETLAVFVVYGWQGADRNPQAAARTDAL